MPTHAHLSAALTGRDEAPPLSLPINYADRCRQAGTPPSRHSCPSAHLMDAGGPGSPQSLSEEPGGAWVGGRWAAAADGWGQGWAPASTLHSPTSPLSWASGPPRVSGMGFRQAKMKACETQRAREGRGRGGRRDLPQWAAGKGSRRHRRKDNGPDRSHTQHLDQSEKVLTAATNWAHTCGFPV